MQRFVFTLFFVILCLGQAEANAQHNSNPPDATPPSISEQDKNPTEGGNGEADEAENQTYNRPSPAIEVSGKEIPVLSSADKIAQKGNIFSLWQTIFSGATLILAGFATLFALGAWLSGRKAVSVGKIDAMANLMVKNIRHSALIFGEGDKMRTHKMFDGLALSIEFMVSNRGRSMAKNVSLEMRSAIIAKNPDEHYRQISRTVGLNTFGKEIENPVVSRTFSRKLDDIPASETVPVRQGFALPHGDAVRFKGDEVVGFTIQYIELQIILRYETAFGDKTVVKQTFGIRALKKDGIVERIAHNQNNK